MKNFTVITLMCIACLGTGCEKSARSFSLLAEDESFQQVPIMVERKVDVLWVIDNSGSMETSQATLAASFQSFISRFESLDYDFHMAVTTSDAYRAEYINNNNLLLLRDGRIGGASSGYRIMDQNTPDLANVFMMNISQGITGSGDERAFQSFKNVLQYSANADFRRSDAFLSIIIVSDEDDFSSDTAAFLGANYNSPHIVPVSTYTTFLQDLTESGRTASEKRNFSVNAIAIDTDECLDDLTDEFPGRLKGNRYMELVATTGGVSASLCSNFGESLELISKSIIALTTTFKLDREPIPESIHVYVDNASVPEDATNGWSYNATTQSVTFNGTAVPAEGAEIIILFDPVSVKL